MALIAAVLGNYWVAYKVKEELLVSINKLQTDVAVLTVRVNETKEISQQTLAQSRAFYQRSVPTSVPTTAGVVFPQPGGISITPEEAHTIRAAIKTGPITTAAPIKIKIGMKLPDSDLKPLPPDVVAKLPSFKGVRYAIDKANNLIALTSASGEVFALI